MRTFTFFNDHPNTVINWLENKQASYVRDGDFVESLFMLEDEIKKAGLTIDMKKLERLAASLEHNKNIQVQLIGMKTAVKSSQALNEVKAAIWRLNSNEGR